jgi:O-antigen/teichoic acid export membrane protein
MYPELQISLRWPNPNVLRSLWGYGFYAFIINICIQIIYYTDNIIVGTFISAGAVTFYAIGGNLIEYLRQLVSSMTMTFTPLASTLEAQTQQDQLRRLLVHGTRAALIIALPIEVVLFFRGHTFIGLWMGEQYAQVSGRVLQILLLAQLFAIANFTSGGIAYGMAKHRPVALWAAGEAIFNLVLSVLLVRLVGLEGVAWGTVIPALAIHMLLWPRYICKLLEVPVWSYLWQGWIRPGLAVIPFSIACCFADHFWIPHSLVSFFLQIAVMLPLFFLGFGICFWQEAYSQLRTRTKWFTGNLLGAPEFPPGRVTNSKTPNY